MKIILFIFFLVVFNTYVYGRQVLKTGIYGDYLEVVQNEDGSIMGLFEYYENFNHKTNEFEKICELYFYGNKRSHDTFFLKVGL